MNQLTEQPNSHPNKIQLKQLINDKMNNELKLKYSQILEQQYDVFREKPSLKKSSQTKNLRLIILFILIALISSSLFLNTTISPKSNQQEIITKAQQYIANNEVENYNVTRGTEKEMVKIKSKNSEDLYFTAMSLLELGSYESAIEVFHSCLENLKKGDNYFHEANLYLVLSYILNNQINLANHMFQELDNNSWEYKQLQHILG